MAVEKLILRSILYGADKIPDSWFEKLPGGYYRDSHGRKRKIGDKNPKPEDPKGTSRGRKAESSDFYPQRDCSERGRERHRNRGRERRASSYDGGDDDDADEYYYYREDGRPYRSKSRRRRRSADGHRDRYNDRRRQRRYDERGHRHETLHDDRHRGAPYPPGREPEYARRPPAAYLERGSDHMKPRFFEAGAATDMLQYLRRDYGAPISAQPPPPMSRNAPISDRYVPYAHIYGTARQSAPQPEPLNDGYFNRSDMRSRGSPTAPYPQGYSQNQFTQRAPPADVEYAPQRSFNKHNTPHVGGSEAFLSDRYESFNDAPRTRNEREMNGDYSHNPGYSRHRDDRHRSDFDAAYGKERRRRREANGYYSE